MIIIIGNWYCQRKGGFVTWVRDVVTRTARVGQKDETIGTWTNPGAERGVVGKINFDEAGPDDEKTDPSSEKGAQNKNMGKRDRDGDVT